MSIGIRKTWIRNHIQAVWIGESNSKITDIWEIIALISGMSLGIVKWYAPWRRYVFYPGANTLYDAACLTEIADVCEERTNMHKNRNKK